MIEQNREIISQLYTQICSQKQMPGHYPTKSNSPSTIISAKPACLRAFKKFFSGLSEAFPDFKINIDSLIAKEDRVMARYTISGIQKGYFMGMAPTNEPMTVTGIDVFRLDDGKVIEHWDTARQVCALPMANSGTKMTGNKKKKKTISYTIQSPKTNQLSFRT